MIIASQTLARIASGEIRLAFRRRTRPTVRSGGTLLTAAGLLQLGRVTVVHPESITPDDARLAGFDSLEELLGALTRRTEGNVYRIELESLSADPRIALREAPPSASELEALRARLERLDRAAPGGPWTRQTLEAIHAHPGLRAADLCKLVGQERDPFKTNVRKLKNLGLTESLEVGYRLSPRGAALLKAERGRLA